MLGVSTYMVCKHCGRQRLQRKTKKSGSKGNEWRCYHCRTLRKKYGMVHQDYIRMIETQKNLCGICNKELTTPFIDHDHLTNNVRGLLCYHCNFGLGHFRDCPDNLTRAIEYLRSKKWPPGRGNLVYIRPGARGWLGAYQLNFLIFNTITNLKFFNFSHF